MTCRASNYDSQTEGQIEKDRRKCCVLSKGPAAQLDRQIKATEYKILSFTNQKGFTDRENVKLVQAMLCTQLSFC